MHSVAEESSKVKGYCVRTKDRMKGEILQEVRMLRESIQAEEQLAASMAAIGFVKPGMKTKNMLRLEAMIKERLEELKNLGAETESVGAETDIPPHVQAALKVLGLSASHVSPEKLKEAYRKLAKMHHPDAGGDEKEMARMNRAYEIAEKWLRRECAS